MPVPPPAKNPASGLGSFLKGNAKFMYGGGALGAAFVAADIKNILDSDNKMKALLKTMKDFLLIRISMAAVFKGVGDAIKGLVRDTGSLDAALKKLSQLQQYARQFQQFTGGINSAKQRVSELHRLSLRQPFKFEEIAEANKSLEIFTRGAYSSVQATQEVGKAALASGNNIQDTARAVGMLYDNLRSGVPIRGTAEQLRQMGLISQATADQLTTLNETGADSTTVFNEFTKAMQATGRGAAEYKDTIEGVTAEHEKAVEALKVAFGEPFTKGEIDNTKNMTRAMQEITPTVAALSKGASFLYGGFSTAISGMAKFAASSKIVQTVIQALGGAIGAATVALGVFGAYVGITLLPAIYGLTTALAGRMIPLLITLGLSETAAGAAAVGLGVALNALAAITVYGAIAGFVVALGGAAYSMYKMEKQSDRAFDKQKRGWAESTAAIGKQIAAVTTLAQKNEVLVKAVQAQIAAEQELAAIKKKQATQAATPRLAPISPGGITAPREGAKRQEEERKGAEKNVESKKRMVAEAMKLSALDSEHLDSLIKAEELTKAEREDKEKSVGQRQQEIQAALSSARAAEEQRSSIDEQLIGKRENLTADKQAFQDAQKTKTERKAELQALKDAGKTEEAAALERRFKKTPEGHLTPEEREAEKQKFREREADIAELEARRTQVGVDIAGKESSTYLQAHMEQLQAAHKANIIEAGKAGLEAKPDRTAKEERELTAQRAELENQRRRAGGVTYDKADEARTKAKIEIAQKREAELPQLNAQKQQVDLQRFQIDNEVRGQTARARGDVKTARASEDLSRFTSHFDQLISAGFGKPEAIQKAMEQTTGDIAEELAGARPPVSAMQAMGGGGNLPGVDASMEIARRQEALQQKMVDYLGIMAGVEPQKPPAQAVFQQ